MFWDIIQYWASIWQEYGFLKLWKHVWKVIVRKENSCYVNIVFWNKALRLFLPKGITFIHWFLLLKNAFQMSKFCEKCMRLRFNSNKREWRLLGKILNLKLGLTHSLMRTIAKKKFYKILNLSFTIYFIFSHKIYQLVLSSLDAFSTESNNLQSSLIISSIASFNKPIKSSTSYFSFDI